MGARVSELFYYESNFFLFGEEGGGGRGLGVGRRG